jgi:hypothetical protein
MPTVTTVLSEYKHHVSISSGSTPNYECSYSVSTENVWGGAINQVTNFFPVCQHNQPTVNMVKKAYSIINYVPND